MEPLARAIDRYRAWPPRRHLAACLALALVALVRYGSHLVDPAPLVDEEFYVDAFAAVARGDSPYSIDGYYYPAAFAAAGSWLHRTGGLGLEMAALRLLSIVGAVATVWIAVAACPGAWRRRVLVAATMLSIAPGFMLGFEYGNVSLVVGGALAWGLWTWARRPLAAGLVLGLSTAMKPLAPPAVVVLALHRPSPRIEDDDERTGRPIRALPNRWTTALVAGAAASALLLGVPGLGDMLQQRVEWLSVARTASLLRLLALGGLDVPASVVVLAVTAVTAVVARAVRLEPLEVFATATAAAALALPAAWSHSLLFTLPAQIAALTRATTRWRVARRARWPEPVLVVLATLSIHGVAGVGGVDVAPLAVQAPVVLLPLLAPAALAAYLVATRPGTGSGDSSAG